VKQNIWISTFHSTGGALSFLGDPFSETLSVLSVCPVCLLVTLVYFGQTVEWIRMPLGMEVILGSCNIVLDGNPAPHPPLSQFTYAGFACVCANRGTCILWPNGWMDQDATWYTGKLRPRRHCVRWRPRCPLFGKDPNYGGLNTSRQRFHRSPRNLAR